MADSVCNGGRHFPEKVTVYVGIISYGFPNMVVDNPLLELLLADSDRYDFAEERRLFYVALTRTKNRVWLVTGDESSNPGISMFVDELRRDNEESPAFVFYSAEASDPSARCPRCGGVLLRRTGPNGDFIGCSNYPFCDKSYRDVRILEDKKKCPVCGGWLTRRVNRREGREFYGCTNWPTYCSFTMNLDGTRGSTRDASRGTRLSGSIPVSKVSMQYDAAHHATPRCPSCGASMVLRNGPHGQFYGCSRYPRCMGTRSYPS